MLCKRALGLGPLMHPGFCTQDVPRCVSAFMSTDARVPFEVETGSEGWNRSGQWLSCDLWGRRSPLCHGVMMVALRSSRRLNIPDPPKLLEPAASLRDMYRGHQSM